MLTDSLGHSAGGRFHCAEYPAAATWSRHGLGITIDWKEFGEYEMRIDPVTKAMAGCVKGSPADWRRAVFVKALSPVETLLFGKGGGTEWKFEYPGGSFGIQLKAGGDNQLACPSYPDETARFALDAHGSGNASRHTAAGAGVGGKNGPTACQARDQLGQIRAVRPPPAPTAATSRGS